MCGGAHFNLTKPSNDVQVVNVKKNGFNPKIVSKNTLSQRAPTGAAVATKHLPVVVPVARVTPRIMAGTNAIPIPTIKSKKSIADRGVSRLGSRSSSLGADERLDRDNKDILGRHEHVSLLQPSKAASEGGEENQGGREDKAAFLSSIFRIGPGAGAGGCLAGCSNDTVVAPTDGVQTNATRGGAVTPVVVVGRREKIQQKQIQNQLVFPGLSIEMKKIIVDDENGFNNSKISIGRHATTVEVESTGAAAMQQRGRKKEYSHIWPDHGGPGHEIGQHSSAAEAGPRTLVVCLTTEDGLSVRGRGGDLSAVTVSSFGGAVLRWCQSICSNRKEGKQKILLNDYR